MKKLKTILNKYKKGEVSINQVVEYIARLPYLKLKEATLDLHREVRRKYPEFIYAKNKTPQQLVEIINAFYKHKKQAVVTKLDEEKYGEIKHLLPKHSYFKEAQILLVGRHLRKKKGFILIITAGTADVSIAKEASLICQILGNKVKEIYDVGVAGLHRVLEILPYIRKAEVIIVIAGMDGVLPSVIAGISKVPVVAVPTSTGYGASFKGLSALLTMLNSCSPGVAVVNIDNGFGAGYIASMINQK